MIKTIPHSGNAQPSDFVAYNGPVAFEQNQECSSVLFIIKLDNIDEDEEVFEVSLAGAKPSRSLREKRTDNPRPEHAQGQIRGEPSNLLSDWGENKLTKLGRCNSYTIE